MKILREREVHENDCGQGKTDRNKDNRIQPVCCLSSVKKKTRTIQDNKNNKNNKNNTPGILSEDLMMTTFREK